MAHLTPTIDELMEWEDGTLDDEATVSLFQRLIDSGLCWQLQGCYGRTATDLIRAGLCHNQRKDD